MDTFIWMAEHVAIRGLDDDQCEQDHHYLSRLPDAVVSEPYSGYHDPSKFVARDAHGPVRRIECLTAAHKQLRTQAERQLQELRSRPSSSDAEIAAAEARLERLGEYPRSMNPINTDAAWHTMRECASINLTSCAISEIFSGRTCRILLWMKSLLSNTNHDKEVLQAGMRLC